MAATNVSSIPDRIGQLTNLKHLALGGCQVYAVPFAIQDVPSLRSLVLSGNPIEVCACV